MKRKTLLCGLVAAASAATLGLLPSLAGAQGGYPNRTVVVLSPGAAGGFTDTVSRLIAVGLTERWKVPVVVENRAGAGGTIGAAWAARQPADGYLLFLSNTASDVLSPAIYKKIDYDSLKDFEPVILAVKTPVVLAANMDFPATSVQELIALAKAKPGTINFGYPGNGSTGHLAGTLFSNMAGVQLSPVPYKGTPEIMGNIVNGIIQLTFDNAGLWAPHIKSGRVRPLAVTSLQRSPLLPDVPTFNELGLTGYEAVTFAGISVPKGTPKEIIDKANRDIQAVIDSPEFRAKMAGGEVVTSSPDSYRQFLFAEQAKWGAVVRQVGLRVD
jgi:tripartite-type tricarboxylate transporter receptor subunit TctC